jgi:hypothetical protein
LKHHVLATAIWKKEERISLAGRSVRLLFTCCSYERTRGACVGLLAYLLA